MRSVIPFSLVLMVAVVTTPVKAEQPGPNPSLAPEQVVRLVMQALAKNDEPYANHGIEVTFGFASPANKAVTGPVERFAAMVRGPVYGAMVNHRGFQLENIQRIDGQAQIDIVLISARGQQKGFRFVLSRQQGNVYDGSWMTDAVMPFEVVTL